MKSAPNEMERDERGKKCNVYKTECRDFQTYEGDLSKWWSRKLSVIRSCAGITAAEITRRGLYTASDCISKLRSHYRGESRVHIDFSHAENRAYWSRLMKDHPLQPPLPPPSPPSAIQTPFLEKHLIKNQHCITIAASSHNTPSNLHQSFCCGNLAELPETAQSVITDGKMRGFYFRMFVFEVSSTSSIMAGWLEIKGGKRRGGGAVPALVFSNERPRAH